MYFIFSYLFIILWFLLLEFTNSPFTSPRLFYYFLNELIFLHLKVYKWSWKIFLTWRFKLRILIDKYVVLLLDGLLIYSKSYSIVIFCPLLLVHKLIFYPNSIKKKKKIIFYPLRYLIIWHCFNRFYIISL